MRKAKVLMHDIHAGTLEEIDPRKAYRFTYSKGCWAACEWGQSY